jgi:hypothetical protein
MIPGSGPPQGAYRSAQPGDTLLNRIPTVRPEIVLPITVECWRCLAAVWQEAPPYRVYTPPEGFDTECRQCGYIMGYPCVTDLMHRVGLGPVLIVRTAFS